MKQLYVLILLSTIGVNVCNANSVSSIVNQPVGRPTLFFDERCIEGMGADQAERQEIRRKVMAIVAGIAKNMNAIAVLGLHMDDTVYYIDSAYDITLEVIERLNKEHLENNQRYNCNRLSCNVCSKNALPF